MIGRWEPAFVAVSAVLGEPAESIASALGEEGVATAADLLRGLGAPTRDARARALARALSDIAIAVEASRVA